MIASHQAVLFSQDVAKVVHDVHAEWLSKPGKNGQKHNDSDMRRIRVQYGEDVKTVKKGWMDKYLESWELLD